MNFKTKPNGIELMNFCVDFWKKIDLHKIWEEEKQTSFILHDGPPYANGDIHLGHAVNKIIKDTMNRFMHLKNYQINYVMGWDCNGLPIEAKIESEFRSKGLRVSQVPVNDFLARCAEFANHWIEVQKNSFEKIGVIGSKDYYTTIQPENQLKIVEILHKFVRKGLVFRGLRPTLWSCEEQTALAEAEVQYLEKESNAIDLAIEICASKDIPELQKNSYIVIWTTTPWTIPANAAIAMRMEFEYSIINWENRNFVVASKLLEEFCKRCEIHDYKIIKTIRGRDLLFTTYSHPLYDEGFPYVSSFYPSEHVTDDQGTGFVHLAPDHGLEDFRALDSNSSYCKGYILNNGFFRSDLPPFLANRFFSDAELDIISILSEKGLILSAKKIKHQYPHSWRSGKPLIYRATDQCFIDINNKEDNLKKRALEAAEKIDWFSEASKERFIATLKSRDSWCISRQRLWGTPICIFYDKETGKPIVEEKILQRTIKYLRENGISSWRDEKAATEILGESAKDYTKETAIVDVWFESGCTQFFTDQLPYPADMRVEGSDQHRGWFQSSTLIACLDSAQPPANRIKTHGYVVDKEGQKMSKSKGNGMEPIKVVEKYGADVLRLLILRQDINGDISWNENHAIESQKMEHRFRNTIKFLIQNGNLNASLTKKDYDKLSILEKWLLKRLYDIGSEANQIDKNWNFHSFIRTLYHFCDKDLSSLYFDIRKDPLYFDPSDSELREQVRTCLGLVFQYLLRWIAPIMPFGTEEAWQIANKAVDENNNFLSKDSIHAKIFLDLPEYWNDLNSKTPVENMFNIKKIANAEMEILREKGVMKSSLDAELTIAYPDPEYSNLVKNQELLRSICIVSKLEVKEGNNVQVFANVAEGHKCSRCKKVVSQSSDGMCGRCRAIADL